MGDLVGRRDVDGYYLPRTVVWTTELVDGHDPRDPSTWPYPLWRHDNRRRCEAKPWEIVAVGFRADRAADVEAATAPDYTWLEEE